MCEKNNYKLIVIYMKRNGVKWYWLNNFSSSVVLLPRFYVLFSYSLHLAWLMGCDMGRRYRIVHLKNFVGFFWWIWINESIEWLTKMVLKIKLVFYEHFKCFWWKLISIIGNLRLSFNRLFMLKILNISTSLKGMYSSKRSY